MPGENSTTHIFRSLRHITAYLSLVTLQYFITICRDCFNYLARQQKKHKCRKMCAASTERAFGMRA